MLTPARPPHFYAHHDTYSGRETGTGRSGWNDLHRSGWVAGRRLRPAGPGPPYRLVDDDAEERMLARRPSRTGRRSNGQSGAFRSATARWIARFTRSRPVVALVPACGRSRRTGRPARRPARRPTASSHVYSELLRVAHRSVPRRAHLQGAFPDISGLRYNAIIAILNPRVFRAGLGPEFC